MLRCTKLRKYTKSTPPRACNLAWCERDLLKRYDISPDVVRKRGHDVSPTELAKHDTDKKYVFACPCCLDECQNSTCMFQLGERSLTPKAVSRRASSHWVTLSRWPRNRALRHGSS